MKSRIKTGKFDLLDAEIVKAIVSGTNRYSGLIGTPSIIAAALPVAVLDLWGKPRPDMQVEYRLQSLRRKGEISYNSQKWHCPALPIKPPTISEMQLGTSGKESCMAGEVDWSIQYSLEVADGMLPNHRILPWLRIITGPKERGAVYSIPRKQVLHYIRSYGIAYGVIEGGLAESRGYTMAVGLPHVNAKRWHRRFLYLPGMECQDNALFADD